MTGAFRSMLLERRLTVGTWIQVPHPTSAEILANAGFDWIGIDTEHADFDFSSMAATMRGMHGRGAVPVVRVQENDTIQIRKSLDLGAEGVLVPLVNSRSEAERAVAAAKYPPVGVRGFCYSRMNNWGSDFEEYAATANDSLAVIVMIETKQGVEHIDEIMNVEGVDGAFIGPYDMSGSYGVPGQTDSDVVRQACKTVVEACEKAGKAAGLHVVHPRPEAIQAAVDDGYTLICIGVDTVFLASSAGAALDTLKGCYPGAAGTV